MTTWINDPTILLKNENLDKLWPCDKMESVDKFNTMTRLILLITIAGYIATMEFTVIILGSLSIGALTYLYLNKKEKVEGFDSMRDTPPDISKIMPTKDNPLMNVMPADIIDKPDRPEANKSYNNEITNKINNSVQEFVSNDFEENDKIKEKLFRDIGDTWEFEQSMRTWYTTPNTQIPNDQQSFTDFCYGDMKSCKDGDTIACIAPGSNPPRWNDGSNP